MDKYGTYKYQIALIHQYLYKEQERLEYEIKERDIYFRSGRRKKDEVDYLEDMALQIQSNYLKNIKSSVCALIGIVDEKRGSNEYENVK